MRLRMVLSMSCAAVVAASVVGVAQAKDLHPAEVANFRPVTEEMLRNPPPEDWLNWRRTDNNWGYSTLVEITTQNVPQLQLTWSWAMEMGSNQPTPLVHDGIMLLAEPGRHHSGAGRGHGRPNLGVPTKAASRRSRSWRRRSGRTDSRGVQRNIAITRATTLDVLKQRSSAAIPDGCRTARDGSRARS